MNQIKAEVSLNPRHHWKLMGIFACIALPLEFTTFHFANEIIKITGQSQFLLLMIELLIDLVAIGAILAFDRSYMLNFFYRLRAAQESLELSLEAGRMGAWEIDMRTLDVVVNESARKIFGYTSVKAHYQDWVTKIHPEDQKVLNDVALTTQKSDQSWTIEYRFKHPTNGWIWISDTGRYFYNKQGQAVRSRGITRDITALKLREESVRKNNEMLKQTQQLAKMGSWELDLGTEKIKWSDEIYSLFGLEKRGKLEEPPVELLLRKFIEDDKSLVRKAVGSIKKGKSLDLILRAEVYGSLRSLHISARALEEGRVVGFVQDVTDKIASDQKILDQERMLQNSARLSSLAEMAGGIAHEIQNPIAGIRLKTDVIKRALSKGKTPKDLVGDMDSIQADVARCVNIIASMKMLSRDSTTQEKESFNPELVVRQTADLCTTKMTNRGVRYTVESHDLPLLAHGVPSLLSQVLINLLSNAIDSVSQNSPNDERHIAIKLFEKNDKIAISVCDTGPGITEENRERIFQPFFTTKPVGQGTGLGLSISRSILQKAGGDIELVDLKPATFVVTLPKATNSVTVVSKI